MAKVFFTAQVGNVSKEKNSPKGVKYATGIVRDVSGHATVVIFLNPKGLKKGDLVHLKGKAVTATWTKKLQHCAGVYFLAKTWEIAPLGPTHVKKKASIEKLIDA